MNGFYRVSIVSMFFFYGFCSEGTKEITIHEAAKIGNHDVIKNLLDSGTDVDLRDDHNNTALHWAAAHGRLDILTCLLTQGADKDAVGVHGETPLHVSVRFDQIEIARYLLNNDANRLLLNEDGQLAGETCQTKCMHDLFYNDRSASSSGSTDDGPLTQAVGVLASGNESIVAFPRKNAQKKKKGYIFTLKEIPGFPRQEK